LLKIGATFILRFTHLDDKKNLNLVGSHLCQPTKMRILVGDSYILAFIDDYFRKIWVYTLLKSIDYILSVKAI